MTGKFIGCIAAGLLLVGATAHGATQTTNMNVSGEIVASVTVTATDMNFGVLGTTGNIATSNITVTADTGLAYTIALDAGQHANAGGTGTAPGTRSLANGTNYIFYDISDPDDNNSWGDGTAATGGNAPLYPATGTLTGTGAAQVYTANGYTSDGNIATVPTGVYTDTVTVTVNF